MIEIDFSKTSLMNGFWNRFVAEVDERNREAAHLFWETCRNVVSEKKYPPASYPGEAPALRTGRGRDSIEIAMYDEQNEPFEGYMVFVEEQGWYMAALNLGTIPKVAPRPWLKIAEDRTIDRIEEIQYGTN